ncbi:MAG: hypothetical protein CEE38_14105 [Planctomycetes bacterium B3_Pla]|nr:MAG: hypothetical protein CEE38_14105 [Planctomycetes bacterium B3_Pla]
MTLRIRLIIVLSIFSAALGGDVAAGPYTEWQSGPPHDANFFPIAVWLQNPGKADKYKQAGINTYVGLWRGPTDKQLAELRQAGMKVICHQNKAGLEHADDSTIIGWMHGDEPDNAQSLGKGKGYGPPILPEKIVNDYHKIRKVDPTRPVLLNLGQGVAWDGWHGRGVRKNHPEDYPEYIKGCDIASFDIYPAVHSKPEVAGNLWYVAKGVERLVRWTEGKKAVWNCIECTRIHNPQTKATPHQVRCEVWMSLIHGSMGLIYFVHEWEPRFNESALLSDPEMLSAVTKINRQIIELAPVLNSPIIRDTADVSSSNESVPVATMVKKHEGATYLFAVAMREGKTTATFDLQKLQGRTTIEVIGENRTIAVKNGVFQDIFEAWDVHIYRVQDTKS